MSRNRKNDGERKGIGKDDEGAVMAIDGGASTRGGTDKQG